MKIKMIESYAGSDFSLSPGEETTRFSAKEAKRIIAAGHAIAVVKPVVEKAVKKTPAKERRG